MVAAAQALGLNEFESAARVDFERFKSCVFPRANARAKCCKLDALVVWTVMRTFIKGSIEALLGLDEAGVALPARAAQAEGMSLQVLLALGQERVRLSAKQRKQAFEAATCARAIYEQEGLWDDADRILAIHRALSRAQQDQEVFPLRRFHRVYVDEVQDLTNAELVLLLKMCETGTLFLAGDPAQAVAEGVDFRFDEVRSVFHLLSGEAPRKTLNLQLNFRSHSGILEAADVLLEWLFTLFPGSCKKLTKDEGLCKGPRPGYAVWSTEKLSQVLEKNSAASGLIILTPDHHAQVLAAKLRGCMSGTPPQVLGIREAKGLDFAEVLIVDFFGALDQVQQRSWKNFLSAATSTTDCRNTGSISLYDSFPEVETHLKVLYTAMTRAQRRLNMIETSGSNSSSAFFRALEARDRLVPLASDASFDSAMMSPDEWVARGLEYCWEAGEYRRRGIHRHSVSLQGGGAQWLASDFENEVKFIDYAADCFKRAGAHGQGCLRKATTHQQEAVFRHSLFTMLAAGRGAGTRRLEFERQAAKVVVECLDNAMLLEARQVAELMRAVVREKSELRHTLFESLLQPLVS